MTTTTEHDEPEEMRCEWALANEDDWYKTSCGNLGYGIPEACPGCGLRVREIEGEGE